MTCKTEDACYGDCPECKAWEKGVTERQVPVVRTPEINAKEEGRLWEIDLDKQDMIEAGFTLDIEFPDMDVVDEDWLSGVSCNPDEPEMCESCQ